MRDSVSFAGLLLELPDQRLSVPGQYPVALGSKDSAVLGLLMQAKGAPVSTEELESVSGATAARFAVADLTRLLRALGASAPIVDDGRAGWRLAEPAADETVSYLDLSLNTRTRRLCIDGEPAMVLGSQQNAVLALLIRAETVPVSAGQIQKVSRPSPAAVAISNLSSRLDRLGACATIHCVPDEGWRLISG